MNAVVEKEILLSVNQGGLMKGLKHAFTENTTLFKEMLQNCERAGATVIHVNVVADEQDETRVKVIITDNGCGIQEMEPLLTVAASGWSEEIMANRMPYGLGFLSALYASRSIEVESLGFKMTFDSDDALSFRPILVKHHPDSTERPGTRFVLHGINLPVDKVNSAIHGFAKGFPVKVILNGEDVPRNDALDADGANFVETEIGMMSVPGFETGVESSLYICYLQGFNVHCSHPYFGNDVNRTVIHLDPKKFVARMPDRDVLIDEKERVVEIRNEICAQWRKLLEKKKAEMSPEDFLDRYWKAIEMYAKNVINDIPFLPKQAVDVFTDQPNQIDQGYSDRFQKSPDNHLRQEDVASGKIRLVSLDSMSDESVASWNFAWARNALEIDLNRLHEDHWAKPYVLELDDYQTDVVIHGQYAEGSFYGQFVDATVILCESFDIHVINDEDERVDSVSIDSEIIYDGMRFLVPRKASGSGWAVQQASSYTDEHENFMEPELDEDTDDLSRKISELRGEAPATLLEGLLGTRCSLRDYPSFRGKRFVLCVSPDGNLTVTEEGTGIAQSETGKETS